MYDEKCHLKAQTVLMKWALGCVYYIYVFQAFPVNAGKRLIVKSHYSTTEKIQPAEELILQKQC